MAKTKFLVLALALLVAAGGFAVPVVDGLDISGSVTAGVRMAGSQQDDVKEGDQVIVGGQSAGATARFHDDSHTNADKDAIRVDVTFKYEKDAQGAVVTLRSQPPYTSAGFVIEEAYGWTDFIIPMLKLTGGKGMASNWATWSVSEGNWVDNGFEWNRGARLEVLPIDGLSIGASFFTFDFLGNDKVSPKDHFGFTVLGAGYSSDALKVKGALSATFDAFQYTPGIYTRAYNSAKGVLGGVSAFESALDGYKTASSASLWNSDEKWGTGNTKLEDHKYFEILGGFSYLGIDNLTLSLDFDVKSAEVDVGYGTQDKTKAESYSDATFALFGKYTMGALSLPLYLVLTMESGETLENATDESGDTIKMKAGEFLVRVQPGYKITDNISASLRLQFSAEAFTDDNYKKALLYTASGGQLDDAGKYKSGPSQFLFRPRVDFNFGNGVSFYVWYQHAFDTPAKIDAQYLEDLKVKQTQTVQLEFKYSF